MKKDKKYIILLISLFVLYILVEVLSPPPINWNVTYDENHKIPYGTFALNSLLPDLFPGQRITNSNSTIYDLIDGDFKSLIIISQSFSLGEEDEASLLEMLDQGKHVFIAAERLGGKLMDSLKISVSHSIVKGFASTMQDSVAVFMAEGTPFTDKGPYNYLTAHASLYFYSYDTSKAEVLAVDESKDPFLIRYKIGNGELVLSTLPMAFTNFYLMMDKNHNFASNALSVLPVGDIHLTNFYHYGRLEPLSKLRFILSHPSLKWGYYLAIFAVVLFMIFESKRRQRPIPVITPPSNSTLDFIGTMGNLYLNKGNNINIANKKITYFLDYLRQRYFLKTDKLDDEFAERLAMKTSRNVVETKELVALIRKVELSGISNDDELLLLNDKIEDYYFN
jgi:hypothetical protein